MTTSPEPVDEPPPTEDSAERQPTEAAAAPEPAEAAAPAESSVAAELRDRWRRALADLDNLRKRHTRELAHERETERSRVCTAWLPVLDNLELALTHAESGSGAESGTDSVVQGVKAVRDQAVDVLDRLGYPRDDETGVLFDPLRHEVVSVVDDPGTEPGTVVTCLRPGYGTPGHQLRPMAAVVSKRQE